MLDDHEREKQAEALIDAAKPSLTGSAELQPTSRLSVDAIKQAAEAAIRYGTMEVFREYATPAAVLALTAQVASLYAALKAIYECGSIRCASCGHRCGLHDCAEGLTECNECDWPCVDRSRRSKPERNEDES